MSNRESAKATAAGALATAIQRQDPAAANRIRRDLDARRPGASAELVAEVLPAAGS